MLALLTGVAACGTTDEGTVLGADGAQVDDSVPAAAPPDRTTGGDGAPPSTESSDTTQDQGQDDDPAGSSAGPPPVPRLAPSPEGLAAQIEAAEAVVRDPDASADELAAQAHLQQVAYRRLAELPSWHDPVIADLPAELRDDARRQLAARLEFTSMNANPPDDVPAWRVVAPEPADELLAHYQEGEAVYGVPWPYLAAINLVETGMGRIQGTSSAGAQGPMQFIPSTWERFGEGDVTDPHDAILAAARYLAHNGAADGNLDGALFNYNNDVRYVRGVTAYAQIIEADPTTYQGFHQWQIWYASEAGDVLLPEGYHLTESQPAATYATQHPTRTR